MSDTLKDLADRMIAALHTQDKWSPLGTKNLAVPTKNLSISDAVGTLGSLGTEKQDMYLSRDVSATENTSSHLLTDNNISLVEIYKTWCPKCPR
jgi:hypothetical protein